MRAPVSRIKRLWREAVLRFHGEDLNALLRSRLQALLRTANFEFSKDKSSVRHANEIGILVVVEDDFI